MNTRTTTTPTPASIPPSPITSTNEFNPSPCTLAIVGAATSIPSFVLSSILATAITGATARIRHLLN